jgi:hypothetical protein
MPSIENLASLIGLISKQKIYQIEIISESQISTKLNRLYTLFNEGVIKSDKDIIDYLYDGEESKSKNSYKLKTELHNRLINTLFFIDINNYSKSKYEVALHNSYRKSMAVIILLERIYRGPAIELAEQIISDVLEYDLVELAVMLFRRLGQHYALFEYNQKKSTFYFDLLEKYSKFLQHELLSEKIYSQLGHYVFSSEKIFEINHFKQDLERLKEYQKSNTTFYFNLMTYSAFNYYYLFRKDYESLLQLSTEAISFFNKKRGFSGIGKYMFLFQKAYCLFILNEPYKSLEFYLKAKATNPSVGSLNWFNLHSYLFNNYLILEKYDACYDLMAETLNHKNINKLPIQYRQVWAIKEAYFNYLIRLGKVEIQKNKPNKLRSFRINRFLNEVPHFSKDKRGLNIAILIIQMLFYLADRKYNNFIDRMDALNQYAYRYLRNDDNLRSNCFIKMILKIPDAHYHPVAVQRHVKNIYDKMIQAPPEISEHAANVEIIPYETLWEMVLELLEKNRKG